MGGYTGWMTNQQFKPPNANHDIEIQLEGKTHKGQYHVERENIVVSYMGASKLAASGADNDTLARSILKDIVSAKQQH